MLRQLLIGLTLSFGLSSTAHSDTLSFFQGDGGAYSDTEDTFMTSSGDWEEENFSTESWLYIDEQDGGFGNGTTSSLIRFPDAFGSAEGQIPAEAEIISATVQIYVSNPGDSIQIFELLEDWDVDEVSWAQRSDTLGEWSVSGAQEHPSHATKVLEEFAGKEGSWTILDVKQAVKFWAEQPDQNFGVLLQATGTDGTDIASSESSEITHRPMMIVVFSLPDDWEPGDGEDTGEGEGDGGTDTQDTGSEQGGDEGDGGVDSGSEADGSTGTGDGGADGGDLKAGGCGCALGTNPVAGGTALWLVMLLFLRRRVPEEYD